MKKITTNMTQKNVERIEALQSFAKEENIPVSQTKIINTALNCFFEQNFKPDRAINYCELVEVLKIHELV